MSSRRVHPIVSAGSPAQSVQGHTGIHVDSDVKQAGV